MAHATVNGVDLFYEDGGDGEPIIIHHGYTGSHDSWVEVAPRLRQQYRTILMDGRGAGDSGHPESGYTIEQYADDVVGMADHLGLDHFTYVGHSMGGVIGMELGIRYGDRLDKLVLVAPAPADGVQSPPEMHERSARLRRQGARETMIRERMATTARVRDPRHIEAAVDRALSVSDAHFEDSWKALVEFNKGDQLATILTPTLVIAGAADGLLAANLKDFQRLPNATLHVFSRVSHGLPREVPEEMAEVIADFMEHGVVTALTLMEDLRAGVR
jgi:3-oxoadipate enol-lactonase